MGALAPGLAFAGSPSPAVPGPMVAQAQATPQGAKPKAQAEKVVNLRGTVEAIDLEKRTVTIKGPNRSLTVQVRDPKKLEAVKVGDPVVGKYYEAVALEVKKAGTATPGVTTQAVVGSSKPGTTPAGVAGEQVTITATIVAIDKATRKVTVKNADGSTETVTARDPKNLELIAVGDLAELTYVRALAIALDKSAKK